MINPEGKANFAISLSGTPAQINTSNVAHYDQDLTQVAAKIASYITER